MNDTTTPVTIDDRREEVSFEQAIKTLRFALRDRRAQNMIDDIAAKQAH